MLTRQDREDIKAIVMSFATRISELPEIQSLHDGDYITVVQSEYDRTYSKKASIHSLLDLVKLMYPDQNGAKYQGLAHPEDTVIVPVGTDGFWIAIEPGIYTNYGNIMVEDVPKIIYYNVSSGEWSYDTLWGDTNGTARTQLRVEGGTITTDKFALVEGEHYYIEAACIPSNSLGTIILNEYDRNGELVASTRGVNRVTITASVSAYYGKFVIEPNPLHPMDVGNSAVLVTSSVRSLVEGLYRYPTGYDALAYRISQLENEFNVGGRVTNAEAAIANINTTLGGKVDTTTYEANNRSIASTFESIQRSISTLSGQIDGKVSTSVYNTDQTAVSNRIGSVESSVSTLSSNLSTLSTSYNTYVNSAESNIVAATWGTLRGNTGTSASYVIHSAHIPTATANAIGGIKVGSRLSITDGVLNVPIASTNGLGVIKVGSGLSIDANGVLSASGGGGGSYLPLSAGSSNPLTGELFANAGISVENSTSDPAITLKGASAKLRLLVNQSKTFLQSGNANFTGNTEMWLTGYNGNVGSSLVLRFTEVNTNGDIVIGGNAKVTDYLGVGINPTSSWRAYINGNMNVAGSDLHLTGSANVDTFLTVQGSSRSISFGIGAGNVNRGIWDPYHDEWMIYNDDTYTRVSRNFVGTGAVTAGSASDVRLKDNIVTMNIEFARHIVLSARPVTFTWNNIATKLLDTLKGDDFGLVAQEVETVVPQAISPIWDKYKRVDHTKYISPMLAMMQDHEERIMKLEKVINKLN